MLRKTLNASRLQEEVKRRLQRRQEVVEDGVKIVVPRPQVQEPDRTGCNWTMRHFGNAAGFESTIAGVLAQVQAEYNLAADAEAMDADTSGQTPRANPFGDSAPKPVANPFGGDAPAKAADPFGAFGSSDEQDDEKETPGKRPANPFGD